MLRRQVPLWLRLPEFRPYVVGFEDAHAAHGGQGALYVRIRRARGYDKVVLTTPHEVVTGDRADYLLETGIVNITGSVKMTRDDNQLDGGYAVVNLNTGVSRLYPVAPGGRGTEKQVKGLFVPQQKPGAGDGPAGNGR